MPSEYSPNFRIPVGTQVVLKRDFEARGAEGMCLKKAGSVGEVTEQPLTNDYSYVVAFADGTTAQARIHQLSVRRSMAPEREGMDREVSAYETHLILRVAMGSQAYGLSTADSDLDEKGIFLPPAEWHWSLHPLPEQIEFKRTPEGSFVHEQGAIESDDFCWWELQKFLHLAIRANPTALELLFAPECCVLHATDLGKQLLELRASFLSKYIFQTYSGYALSQFRRMKRARAAGKGHKPKHAMHLVRLLLSGISGLRNGVIQVDVTEHRDELLAMKSQEMPFEQVYRRALELEAEFQRELGSTSLPEKPDVETVDRFLVQARRSVV